MSIYAIDPGPVESAVVHLSSDGVGWSGKYNNEDLKCELLQCGDSTDRLVIEMIASYGMPVGREVFETCVWIGRFVEAWSMRDRLHWFVYRRDVKLHLCGSMRAKDGNVRQALIDRWGGKAKAIGSKAEPGPLYKISGDVWSALAVAVTYDDQNKRAAA